MIESGIYQITCTVNRKIYIGSSINIKNRWYTHKYSLARGKHWNLKLQRAWDKYGSDKFLFEIVQPVFNYDNLHILEEKWIKIKGSFNNGYNIVERPAAYGKGRKSPGTGFKIWDSRKKNGRVSIIPSFAKSVIGMDDTGKVLHRYRSTGEAEKLGGYSSKGVYNSIRRKQRYKSLVWCYEKDYSETYIHDFNIKVKEKLGNKCTVYLDKETGIYYESLDDLSFSLGKHYSNLLSELRQGKHGDRYQKLNSQYAK